MNRQERIEFKSIHRKIDKRISKKKHRCMHEGCSNYAINSHSIQKNGSLKYISENGEVYSLDTSFHRTQNVNSDKTAFSFVKKSIGHTTTFPGFCNPHDGMFALFENGNLDCRNKEHLSLLFYRTIAFECARKKEGHFRWSEYIRETGKIFSTAVLNEIDAYSKYNKVTGTYHLQKAREIIDDKLFDELTSRYFIIDRNIEVACSTAINLHLDNFGKFILDNPGKPIPTFILNLLPYENKTYFIVSWLKEFDEYATWLIDAFDNIKDVEFLVNRLCFCDSEDAVISPRLWEATEHPEVIIENMRHVRMRGPLPLEDTPWLVRLD